MFLSGADALRSVGSPDGSWNWVLVGADPQGLPLAGGGSGFVDEMRECLSAHGDAVLFGLIRLTFRKGENQGEGLSGKWVLVFATLDEESSMSAVARGKAIGKRPEMEKVIAEYAHVVDVMAVTSASELTVDNVVERVKKVSILDGELVVPVCEAPPVIAPRVITEVHDPAEEPSPTQPSEASEAAPEPESTPAESKDAEEPPPEAAGSDTPSSDPAPVEKEASGYTSAAAPVAPAEPEKAKVATKRVNVPFVRGDFVDIWSHTEQKWFIDGMVDEIRQEASTTQEGKSLPAGCAKIVYNKGQRGKWLQPEALVDPGVVRKSEKPGPFDGFLKKEAHNIFSEWHTRYFKLKDGVLSWWITLEDAHNGVKPQNKLELVGLQMKAASSSTKFSIRGTKSKGVVYNLDADTGQGHLPVDAWTQALKAHAAYANRLQKLHAAS